MPRLSETASSMSNEILSSGRRVGARCATCQTTVTVAVIAMVSGTAVTNPRRAPVVAMRVGLCGIDSENGLDRGRTNVHRIKFRKTSASIPPRVTTDTVVPTMRAGVVPKATPTR
ncbi:MAG: hypothetical protein EBV53_10590 [Proteobacteria bacterium]|nr:hypothetical protein [Pseudomonadota bacterium]